jgi:plastocyanin
VGVLAGSRVHALARGRAPWLVLALPLVVLVAVACSSGETRHTVTVDMRDNEFAREVVRVGVGDALRFVNRGAVPHNAIAIDGSWSTGAVDGGEPGDLLEPGEEVTVPLDAEGVFTYYCSLHAPADASSGMVATVVVGDVAFQSAGDDAPSEPVREWTGATRRVPEDHPTIQNAVDAADPGDLILVGPAPAAPEHLAEDGRYVYREQVEVTTPYLTIRGTDRNEVIVDGEHQRPMGIVVLAADGVAVENLTVRNATGNGIYWTSLRGYRGSYLTASNNGVYGIYAFDATDGLFQHSYASGSGDAGFYIGQCDPCEAVITDVVAERNGLGYSGTNSSDVYLVDSVWRHNIAGIVPNTLDSQRFPPHGNVTIVGNLVHDNDRRDNPALGGVWPSFGTGIMLAGGLDSLVERNTVVNHEHSGIAVSPNLSRNFWMSGGNVVRDNHVAASGYSDLTLSGPALAGNCFADNDHGRTHPTRLEAIAPCGAGATAGAMTPAADADRDIWHLPHRTTIAPTLVSVGLVAEVGLGIKPDVDHRTMPPPPPQEQLPGGSDAPVVPAVDVFATFDIDLDSYARPAVPDDVRIGRDRAVVLAGVPFGIGAMSALYGVLGWLAPFALLTGWVALAFVDLARREDLSSGGRIAWLATVTLVPFVGAPIYLLAAGSPVRATIRWVTVAGGLGVVLLAFVGAVLAGGVL